MTTIDDIAKKTGVSKSTVSRYLNGGSVSESTRKKIDEIVRETGYTPNAFARSLKAKHTRIIGIIVPRLDSEASVLMLKGIETVLHKKGYQTIITNTYQDIDKELEALEIFRKQRADGIILMSSNFSEKHRNAIQEMKVPFISLGQSMTGVSSIVFDDFSAGKIAAEKVVQTKHQKVLFLGVTPSDESVGVKRYSGFKETLEGYSISHDFIEVSFNSSETIEILKEHVKIENYTMIVCATDNIAVSVLKYLTTKSIAVPSDISLIGFGGHQLTYLVTPELDTVKFDYEFAGTVGANGLIDLINRDKKTVNIVLDVDYEAKESVRKIK